MGKRMAKVSVEVRCGTACSRLGMEAKSISRALGPVGGRYPEGEIRVQYLIEPERYFVEEPAAVAGIVGTEPTHQEAHEDLVERGRADGRGKSAKFKRHHG